MIYQAHHTDFASMCAQCAAVQTASNARTRVDADAEKAACKVDCNVSMSVDPTGSAAIKSAIEKKPPTLTKSCLACRTSKVKCELAEGCAGTDACKRCERLGLQCIFEESKRGRPCKNRNVARLGPAVRALLRETAPEGSSSEVVRQEMDRTRGEPDECRLEWVGHECQRRMVQSISSRDGQVALLKHWLLIGVRSGSCGELRPPSKRAKNGMGALHDTASSTPCLLDACHATPLAFCVCSLISWASRC